MTSSPKTLGSALEALGDASYELAGALIFKLPFHFLAWAIVAAAFGIGLLGEILRVWIIAWLAPEAAKHVKAFAVLADVTIGTFDFLRFVVQTMEFTLQTIESLFRRNMVVSVVPKLTFTAVSVAQVTDATLRIQACSDFTAPDAAEYFLKSAASSKVCPVLRSIQPIPYINNTMPILGWLSDDPTPYPGNNCEPKEYVYGVEPELCALLQVGGVMLEFVVPIIVSALILAVVGKQLARFLFAVLWVLIEQIKTIGAGVHSLLTRA